MSKQAVENKQAVGRHSNKIYFRNDDLDLILQGFGLAYGAFGGSSVGEVFYAASQVDEKNLETWWQAWSEIAETAEAQAQDALKNGHRSSAREAYLRALTYRRISTFVLPYTDPRFLPTLQKVHGHFAEAAKLFEPQFERFDIPFDGKNLPGYFRPGSTDNSKRPTLIVIGGGETFVAELYFWGGAMAFERGYNVLLVDLPGQGMTPEKGFRLRPDVEVPMSSVLDKLLERPEVNPQQIGMYGISLGGYLVLRTVAYEKRIRACAVSTPMIDLKRWLMDGTPPAMRLAPGLFGNAVKTFGRWFNPLQLISIEKWFEWNLGVKTLKDALAVLEPYTVEVERIQCPVLCMVGEGEAQTFKTQTQVCFEALKSRKALRTFSKAEGADAHCQHNHLRLGQSEVFDWFDEVFQVC